MGILTAYTALKSSLSKPQVLVSAGANQTNSGERNISYGIVILVAFLHQTITKTQLLINHPPCISCFVVSPTK